MESLRVERPWAVVDLSQPEQKGQLLFHQDDGWRLIHIQSRGTDIPAGEMSRVGVPRRAIAVLLGRQVPPSELSVGPWAEVFSRLRTDQCRDYPQDSWSLMLARNELYARYGRPFRDPVLRAYFGSLPWYRVRSSYSDADLSALERANVRDLLAREREARAKEAVVR